MFSARQIMAVLEGAGFPREFANCVVTGHVCVYDRNGICTDQTRDWCNVCNRCTVWDGEVCTGCGAVWGE